MNTSASGGSAFGWIVALAGAILIAAVFLIGDSSASSHPMLRSEHAAPAKSSMPTSMAVVVSDDGKTFHVSGCTFIHDKAKSKTISSGEAAREGYSPCIRCLRKYAAFAKSVD
ncbi:MAG: hypothetical protein ACRD2U_12170 [Terriglobales bacterium]